tara:strand:+ start:112 stop:768 length:657 start_codon:yes stop_codon:yes gene_type:complete
LNLSILQPLPNYLVKRYKEWKATSFEENKSLYKKLSDEGQHPRAMIISCCDSRVHVTSIFGSEAGEFFIHRNIANLVPPYKPSSDYHGTSAAIEYAVTILKISHIIILGHSSCGGIQGCFNYFSNRQEISKERESFIRSWLELLRPSFNKLNKNDNEKQQIKILEKNAILVSLENLLTFPFVKKAISDKKLTLHGLWHEIDTGILLNYDSKSEEFIEI